MYGTIGAMRVRTTSAAWSVVGTSLAALRWSRWRPIAELALTLAPLLLVAALPLSGLFPGEALIVARRALRGRRPRAGARPLDPHPSRRARRLLLERSPRTLRGPPVAA